jgi:uncharacterized protein YfaS (alpha-2-macroglobulin family)
MGSSLVPPDWNGGWGGRWLSLDPKGTDGLAPEPAGPGAATSNRPTENDLPSGKMEPAPPADDRPFWITDLVTDGGVGTVTIRLPERIATWHVRSMAMTEDARVGDATARVDIR